MPRVLRFVLGDQLSRDISSLRDADPRADVVLLCEVQEEATSVRYHKRKIAFLFSAMRHFADELRRDGFAVDYVRIDDPGNTGSFSSELVRAAARHRPDRVAVTEPGEWRVLEMMRGWEGRLGLPVEIRPDDRFFCSHERFRLWAAGRKTLRMEYFYREMRQRTGYLMDGPDPVQSRWNFDQDNRKSLPADIAAPERPAFSPDATTQQVLDLVAERFAGHFGDLDSFSYPVTRAEALRYLDWFASEALPRFGDYQDAMRQGSPLLFHSHLSALINCGLLGPREVCDRAEQAWRDGLVPINAVEGFIRQIIGWREFIRGVYWLNMPGYGDSNALDAHRPLPDFFWTGETDMNCLRQAIGDTRRNAYAHHIQRLMVIGNFALLCGFDPKEVQEWYLIVYHDAYEWVEMPNVVGMILFADGGQVASKPYAASGTYIDRMSDYCSGCVYSVKLKDGPAACPFNYLYWDFLARNRARLSRNERVRRIYDIYDRLSDGRKASIAADAAYFLGKLAADARQPQPAA